MQSRAYSFIEIKAIDEDQRVLQGIATTPTPDRLDDIVNPMGAQFKMPIPLLWQHKHDKPIGHVTQATPSEEGIPFTASIAKTDEEGELKSFLDMAWQSLKLKLVSAVSIGFNPLKWSFMDNGGIEYQEWEWLELSAVTIPAQPEAMITSLKAFDEVRRIDQIYREVAGLPEPQFPEPPLAVASDTKARVVRLNKQEPASRPYVISGIRR